MHFCVTNVPGPTEPLRFAGARMLEAIPVGPLVPLVGLTVAALSYAGRLVVAVNADGSVVDRSFSDAEGCMPWTSPRISRARQAPPPPQPWRGTPGA